MHLIEQKRAAQPHANNVEHGSRNAEEHNGQQLAGDDLAPLGRAGEQRLQRAAFLFTRTQIDRRIKSAGQRPNEKHEGKDFRPHDCLSLFGRGHVGLLDVERMGSNRGEIALAQQPLADRVGPAP